MGSLFTACGVRGRWKGEARQRADISAALGKTTLVSVCSTALHVILF